MTGGDPIEAFAEAVSGLFDPAKRLASALADLRADSRWSPAAGRPVAGPRPPGPPRRPDGSLDTAAMVREGQAMLAELNAGRQARWERNAAAREQARRAYERAMAAREGAQGAPIAAAAWWDPPQPIALW